MLGVCIQRGGGDHCFRPPGPYLRRFGVGLLCGGQVLQKRIRCTEGPVM